MEDEISIIDNPGAVDVIELPEPLDFEGAPVNYNRYDLGSRNPYGTIEPGASKVESLDRIIGRLLEDDVVTIGASKLDPATMPMRSGSFEPITSNIVLTSEQRRSFAAAFEESKAEFANFRREFEPAEPVTVTSFSSRFGSIGTFTKTPETSGWSDTERAAHTFRSWRIRQGALAGTQAWLQSDPELKNGVAAVVQRGKELTEGTQGKFELHRAYTPLIAGIMSDPESRQKFMKDLDAAATDESDKLKVEGLEVEGLVEGGVETDVLVIGAGVHSAIFSARLRSELPEARIVSIDALPALGGQFRSYGERPVFYINSRNNRPEDATKLGLPGGTGNLNSFGPKAPIQLTDISTETYPTNVEMGETAAINQYLSAETMLGVKLGPVSQREDGRWDATAIDVENGAEYKINARKVIVFSGLGGERDSDPNTVPAEDFFRHFGNPEIAFPMDLYKDKLIAIKGGGDTGRVSAEIFARLAPKAAYGKSTVQFGGPQKVLWYGTEFDDRNGFCDSDRPRYQRLASFIPGLIVPTTAKMEEVRADGNQLIVTGADGTTRQADIVIDATQLVSNVLDPFQNVRGNSLELLTAYDAAIGDSVSYARTINDGIYLGGPVARLPLSERERRTFAEGITENTASIWALQSRTNLLALTIAEELRAA